MTMEEATSERCRLAEIDGERCRGPVKANGYCASHYSRDWRYGDPLYRPAPREPQQCKVVEPDGKQCSATAKKRGMCIRHYKRWERWDDPLGGRIKEAPPYDGALCTATQDNGDPCDRLAARRGWCAAHYARWRVHDDPQWLPPRQLAELAAGAPEQGVAGGIAYRRVPLRRHDGSVRALASVDEEDYQRLAQHRWHLTPGGYVNLFMRGIGRCGPGVKGPGRYVLLHRAVMGCVKGDGFVVDHINGDKLDNRRANLRVVTQQQNRQNVAGYGRHSKHRGVSFDTARGNWMAYGKIPGGRHVALGRFATEAEAAAVAAAFRAEYMPYAVVR